MIKLLRQIFPQGKEGWLKYFDWCGYHSYVFKPIEKTLDLIKTICEWLLVLLALTALILLFPLTRIELRVRSSKVKKKMEEKQNDKNA